MTWNDVVKLHQMIRCQMTSNQDVKWHQIKMSHDIKLGFEMIGQNDMIWWGQMTSED